MEEISWNDFAKVELRVGKIVDVQPFPEAQKPAFKLEVDFGAELGTRKSSAQITDYYSKELRVSSSCFMISPTVRSNRSAIMIASVGRSGTLTGIAQQVVRGSSRVPLR